MASLNTILSDLKNKIQTEVSSWGDTEKSRVSSEIQAHNNDLQQQANTQATSTSLLKKLI